MLTDAATLQSFKDHGADQPPKGSPEIACHAQQLHGRSMPIQ